MKVELYKQENGEVQTVYDRNPRAPGLLRVFITDKRAKGGERPGMQDIMEDIAWRRSVKMTDVKTDPTFKTTIAEYIKRPVEELVFRFNRHCGCAMCPCSPGILVQDRNYTSRNSSMAPEIWVTISDEETK